MLTTDSHCQKISIVPKNFCVKWENIVAKEENGLSMWPERRNDEEKGRVTAVAGRTRSLGDATKNGANKISKAN
jgi:hypothetical protein